MGALPRITGAGATLGVAALSALMLGWALGYQMLSVIACVGIVVLLGACLAVVPLPRLDISRAVQPSQVSRGDGAIGVVAVRNPGRWRTRACTAVDLVSGDEVGVRIRSLGAGQLTTAHYRLPTNRRGQFEIGPLSIVRRDPFGLWEARRPIGTVISLLVRPRVFAIDPRPAGRVRHVEGPVSDTAPRGTLTFHSLREYVAGDDVRRIHWRSSARTGTLMVREHVDTSLPTTVVVIDTRAGNYRGDGFEEAIDVAASVVDSSQRHGFPVHVVATDGSTFTVRSGHRGDDLRDYLATVEPGVGGDMRRVSFDVIRSRFHDALVVVGGEVADGELAAISSMARPFNSATLVSLTSDDPDAPPVNRWPDGRHLSGTTAAEVLSSWQQAVLPLSKAGR